MKMSTSLEIIDKRKATELFGNGKRYARNRHVDVNLAMYYSQLIVLKEFIEGEQNRIILLVHEGKEYIVTGITRLYAVHLADMPVQFNVSRISMAEYLNCAGCDAKQTCLQLEQNEERYK